MQAAAPGAPLAAPAIRTIDPLRDGAAVEHWLRARPDATAFHRPAWSAAVAKGCGQPAHYLAARRGDAIAGVLPLSAIHSPLFGRALVSSGFAVGGGIL
ncbi:MAG: FemAB, partial [Sphingomonas sp.]